MLALLVVGFLAAVLYVHACAGATRQAGGGMTQQRLGGATQRPDAGVMRQAPGAPDQQR